MTTTMTPITPTRVINFANIIFAAVPPASVASARRKPADIRLARRNQAMPDAGALVLRPRPGRPAKLQPMESATLSIPRVSGSMSRDAGITQLETIGAADLALPLGVRRFVNVATLRRLLGAPRSDVLLRKAGDAWEICPDSHRVDLWDAATEYRLGRIQIYS